MKPTDTPGETARVFWTGRSQAVRLPVGFRLDVGQVRISRRGQQLVLEPLHENWQWLDALPGRLDDDAADTALAATPPQRRPALDRLFK